jgi:hypothetical protein
MILLGILSTILQSFLKLFRRGSLPLAINLRIMNYTFIGVGVIKWEISTKLTISQVLLVFGQLLQVPQNLMESLNHILRETVLK